MTIEDARTLVLLNGLEDWVSLAAVEAYVRTTTPTSDFDELRVVTISVVDEMQREGLIQVGELTPRFTAWPLSHDEVIKKLRREWIVTSTENDHGWDWWLDLTSDGKALGRRHERERDQKRKPSS